MIETPAVEMAVAETVAEAVAETVAEQVAEQVAEEAAEATITATAELEQARIDAEVAKVAIQADAAVAIAEAQSSDHGDDERWMMLETFCLRTMDFLETMEASHLRLHERMDELESMVAAGRKAKSAAAETEAEEIEVKPPASETPPQEEPPPAPSITPRKRFLIR